MRSHRLRFAECQETTVISAFRRRACEISDVAARTRVPSPPDDTGNYNVYPRSYRREAFDAPEIICADLRN